MKNRYFKFAFSILIITTFLSCDDSFNVKYDADFKPEQVFVNHDRLRKVGMKPYLFVPSGFDEINDAFIAGASDEAEHTSLSSLIQKINLGAWNQYSNPDDQWSNFYSGIYYANFFLENSVNYKTICLVDTITAKGKVDYLNQIKDIAWLRSEVRFLRAYFHFELMKRYGEIPIITKTLSKEESLLYPRNSIDSCISFIENECMAIQDSVVVDWQSIGKAQEAGRVTKGTVLALKSRLLLYAASPLYNPENDINKWKKAAAASYELISMEKYKLNDQYRRLFTPPISYTSPEVIFYRISPSSNSIETINYPIGTEKGKSGTCPTQNLVDAYEMKSDGSKFDWNNPTHAANPYNNRDPRLLATVVYNGVTWNGRTIETFVGGVDGIDKKEASKTGYYLKKYIVDELDLTQGQKSVHSWILFRYGEILLNYAEAMNEAYGPDNDNGYGKTARQAINEIRGATGGRRIDVRMPAVTAVKVPDKIMMREVIKNERRVELAFEGHRIWDLRRWTNLNDEFNQSDAYKGLGMPVYGIRIEKLENQSFKYSVFKVEDRLFEKKMIWYPIPQSEINKYPAGFFTQNPEW